MFCLRFWCCHQLFQSKHRPSECDSWQVKTGETDFSDYEFRNTNYHLSPKQHSFVNWQSEEVRNTSDNAFKYSLQNVPCINIAYVFV